MFNGRRNDELFREYGHWLPYITEIFLPLCNSENGDLLSMPFPGALSEQPYMTMQVVLLIQQSFKKVLSEKVEKMKTKASAGHARRRR